MRLSKWLSLLLCVCMLTAAMPAAVAEEDVFVEADVSEDVEAAYVEDYAEEDEEEPALEINGGLDLGTIEGGEEIPLDKPAEPEEDLAVNASAPAFIYAKVTAASAPLYFDYDASEAIAQLAKGEVVLLTGDVDGLKAVAINASGRIVEGFMKASDVAELSKKALDTYLNNAAKSGEVALYQNELDWPLSPLGPGSDTDALWVMANYDELSNDTEFVLNGKKIRAGDEPTKGAHNCWKWAQAIYKKVWGCNFDSTFVGTSTKGHNLLRNLTDNERKLTAENVKRFVMNSKPGATIRVQACPSSCSGFNGDGCGSHNKHSLIIAEIRSDGFVTMDDQGKVHTRFYTWQGFCDSWKNWVYVKYIKWPGAPALASAESQDGYSVTSVSDTYRVRATALGAVVYDKPSGGKALGTLRYPDTFSASKAALKTIDKQEWVYGKSSTGVTGWLPLDDAVVNTKDAVKVTDVSLSQSKLALLKGGAATLKATVAPADATNKDVSWSSSDTGVATVSDGYVTGVGAGTATITATTADGSKKASCTVKVAAADASKTLKKTGSNGTVKMIPGMQVQLVLKKGWKAKSVKSSNSKCASVDRTGVLTAGKAGTATITVKLKNDRKATLKVKVVDPNAPTKIVLNKRGTVSLARGRTLTLKAAVSPSTAVTTLEWASSNSKIAAVDGNGTVYGLKKGTCYIGVRTSNGIYAKVKVRVS